MPWSTKSVDDKRNLYIFVGENDPYIGLLPPDSYILLCSVYDARRARGFERE